MKGLAVVLFFVGLMPIALVKPHVGVLAWALSGLMNPHRLVHGFATTFPFSMMIAAVTLISVIVNPKERRPLPWAPPLVVLTILVVWMNITTVFAIIPSVSWEQWEKVMKIMLMTYVGFWVIHTKGRIIALTVVMAFAVGFYGIKGGIFTVLTGGQFMVVGPPKSLISGNTEISLALTMALPYLIFTRQMLSNRIVRLAVLGCIVAVAFAIVGSYSRGAFLAGGAMGFWLWLKSEKKIPVLIGILVMVPVLMNFMPDKYHDKMSTIETYEEDASAMGRINAWWFAFHLANDRPLVGGGFNVFKPHLFHKYAPDPEDYHDAHSNYFQMLGHHGYPGLFLFLALGVTTWLTAGSIVRKTRGREDLLWAHRLGRVTEVSLIGYAVGGAFLTLAYLDFFYYQVVIMLATNRLVDEALAESRETEAVGTAPAAFRRGDAPLPAGGLGSPALAMAGGDAEPGAAAAVPAMARRASGPGARHRAGPVEGLGEGRGGEARKAARPLAGRRRRMGQVEEPVPVADDAPKKKLGAFGLLAAALEVGSGNKDAREAREAREAKVSEAARPLARRRRPGGRVTQ